MSYIINIHAHVELDVLNRIMLALALADSEPMINVTTVNHESEADEVEQVLSYISTDHPDQAIIDEIERMRNRIDHPTNHRLDELDDVIARCDDYESRFRGLLADFEGQCTQHTQLEARISRLEGVAVAQIQEPPL